MHLSSKTLAQAAQPAEQIESLEKQLDDLLQGKEISWQNQRTPKRRVSSPGKSVSSAPKARRGERGTLRPAVVEILKKIKKPLKTADIYDALVAKGYQFTFREPRKVLGIRLYKMLASRRSAKDSLRLIEPSFKRWKPKRTLDCGQHAR